MDWKEEAMEKLRSYEAKKHSITSIPQEIKILRESIYAIRSATSDGSPVSGGGNGRENMLLNNIVKREELERNLRQAVQWVKLVDAGLEVLTPEERLILDRLYIHPQYDSIGKLCQELNIERATAYRRRYAALRHFTMALYGVCES